MALWSDLSASAAKSHRVRDGRVSAAQPTGQLPDLVYVTDTQGRYVGDNPTHCNFLGLRSLEDIVGKSDFDFYPRELAERIRADDQTVLEGKVPVLNREEQFTNHRGEKTLVSTSKVPYRDEQGKIVGLVCISRIISERK